MNKISSVVLTAIILILCCDVVSAQNQPSPQMAPLSDVGQSNMSLVAASSADIKTVLVKDVGLMVELKRWVAKDATDHGQIVSETDLTDDAIFSRLETDVQFRSIATQLVQRYGYLVPKVNPDSVAGKEQDLLIAERVKWITQQEEEDRAQERAKAAQSLQQARLCDSIDASDCATRQQGTGAPGQLQGNGQRNQRNVPAGGSPVGVAFGDESGSTIQSKPTELAEYEREPLRGGTADAGRRRFRRVCYRPKAPAEHPAWRFRCRARGG